MTIVDPVTGLFAKQDFLRLLEEAVRVSREEELPYAVLVLVPQRLPHEDYSDVVRVAAGCVRDLVRDDDIAGRLDDEVLAIGLPNCDASGARVMAHRLQGDLRLRSVHLRNTSWEPGYAVLGEDAPVAGELITCAIEAARGRRRQMASHAPTRAIDIPPALGAYGKL